MSEAARPGIVLRPLTADDAPAIAALAASLPEWFNRGVPALACADAARFPGVAAVDEAEAIRGLLVWERRGREAEIKWIMVAPGLHRQGLGKKLVDHLVVEVRAVRVTRLVVSTVAPTVDYEPYARTRAFYEALGFVLETVEPNGWPEDHLDKATYARAL